MHRLSALAFAASILFAVSCSEGSTSPPAATPEPVRVGGEVDSATLDGKVLFEYRGHFGCPGDESGSEGWPGWAEGAFDPMDSAAVSYLPDVSDLSAGELCETDMGLLDGTTAGLFSSANRRTVVRHFEWMASHGLDGVFLRRVVGEAGDGGIPALWERVAGNVRAGAEAHGRVFAVVYQLRQAAPGDIAADWAHVVEELRLTNSSRYVHHNGRPVLAIDASALSGDTGGPRKLLETVTSVRAAQGEARQAALFVVAPIRWRSQDEGWWADLLDAVDYVSPWAVGESGNETEATGPGTGVPALASEAADAGVGYAPVVWPGRSGNGDTPLNAVPRDGGSFFWGQAYEAVSAGADALYVVSFDGLDDGTAMFELVPRIGGLPVGGNFLSLDADGYDLPSDWFLRLGGESARLLWREIPLSSALPITPTKLPDAARNRVEMTFSTTSDRASVDISTLGNILTVELIQTSGEPTESRASVDGMVLAQARRDGEGGRRVSITVEYTVDEAALRGPMELRMEKGSMGSSELRVVRLTPRGAWVLRQVSHGDTPNLPPGEPLTVVIPWVGE